MTPELASFPNRRHILAGIAALAASGPLASAQMTEKPADPAHARLTAIHYDLQFKATPQRIYTALLDSKQFAVFSGAPAEIDPKPGGAFSLFGGLILGRNIEFVENRRIVQAWRPASWDAGVYSLVRFELKPHGAATSLAFDHTSFPVGDYDHLDWGWHNHYWEPLTKYLV